MTKKTRNPTARKEETLHVKIPAEWYEGLRTLADGCEGTIHQQAKIAIRERLERRQVL